MDKNCSNDNYNLVYSDTMIITTTFAHSVAILLYLLTLCINCDPNLWMLIGLNGPRKTLKRINGNMLPLISLPFILSKSFFKSYSSLISL